MLRSCLLLLAVASLAAAQPVERDRESVIARLETRSLATWHYAPPPLDTTYSHRVFDLYLRRLDPQKRFLLRADVDSLERFRSGLHESLPTGDTRLAEYGSNLLNRRVEEARVLVRGLLEGGIPLDRIDSVVTDAKTIDFSETQEELRKRWTGLLKLQILSRLHAQRQQAADSLEDADSTVERAAVQALPDSAAIRDAHDFVARNLERGLSRMVREERLDRVAVFLGAAANAFDPHTDYFKPETREDFDVAMSGTLEGIGATLREDDGYIKVVAIIPGSASWRQRELKAEDKILKVGQGDEEPVDIVGASVNDAVRLIRGPKGTLVRLTVQKPDGTIHVIPIVRDVVVVEESYAKSAVLEDSDTKKKVGYITLPSFYHDFQNPRGRNSADDVRRELVRLKEQNVDAVVLDLRNNGGGSLEDAVKMAGLFLPWGPIVQVRDRRGAGNVLEDTDPAVVFDGPLAVMVNTFSASASEILAAAMQDYGRGVVIGTDTTFGKGTVQTLINLDNLAAPQDRKFSPLGTVKLTVQKFYRVNGGSTQFKGVIPDILIPDGYTWLEVGESTHEHALPWDESRPLRIQPWFAPPPLAELKSRSEARVAQNAYFGRLNQTLERQRERRNRDVIQLEFSRYFAERDSNRLESAALDSLQKFSTGLIAIPLTSLNPDFASDSLEQAKVEDWKEQLGQDFYLREAFDVLGDWARIGN